MAGLRYTLQTAPTACGAATKKTHIQISAPTNQRVLVREISISFDGTSPVATPINVQIERQTGGTNGSALTPAKANESDAETIQSTAKQQVTDQTSGAEVMGELVHPQTGYTWQAPFEGELIIKGGNKLGICITAPNDVEAKVRAICEE